MREPDTLTDLRLGQVLGGRYRLVGRIGTGGMGSVWKAVQSPLGRAVAVKLLRRAPARDADQRERFEREASIAAHLGDECENIAQVFDIGTADDGTPFVAMELLSGEDLEARLCREGTLAPALALTITRQLCDALRTAHAASIVHRDLKPANVFLTTTAAGEPLVKLLDFGCAKTSAVEGRSAMLREYIVGTPSYMSPEQIAGDADVDASADLWALTVMVYRMLVGRLPFQAKAFEALALRIRLKSFPLPTRIVPTLPPAVDAFVQKGLAKNRALRYESTHELLAALAGALDGARPTAHGTSEAKEQSALRSRRKVAVAAVVGGLIVAVGIAASGGRSPPTVAPAEPDPPARMAVVAPPETGAAVAPPPSASIVASPTAASPPAPATSTVAPPPATTRAPPPARATAALGPRTQPARRAARSGQEAPPIEKKAAASWDDRGQM